jgi:3,5-epimerase/4-reductase
MKTIFSDNRGTRFFPIKNNSFVAKECTVSINKINVFCGIHSEVFEKLVTCVSGRVLDITVNLNKGEPNYLIPVYTELTPLNNNQVHVKSNHGHGFLSLEENSVIVYHFSDIYDQSKTVFINYKDPSLNISLPVNDYEIIISEKDASSKFVIEEQIITSPEFLVFGGNGFIGSIIIDELTRLNKSFYKSNARLEDVGKIENELNTIRPKYVINSAGITGVPNISWCETNKERTIETNVTYQLSLAKLCNERNIHLTVISSGVIFKNDKYYSEEEEGNYNGNFYGLCRIYLENLMKQYKNVLHVRINYPISSNVSSKNLITKLLGFKKIENNTITITYLDELIPVLIDMIQDETNNKGVCNLVNKGDISLIDILQIYTTYKEHSYEITNSQSNNKSSSLLSIGKLTKYNVSDIKHAVDDCIKKYISKSCD